MQLFGEVLVFRMEFCSSQDDCLFQVILVFGAILLLSRRLSDRTLILVGLFLESAAIAFLLWFVPQATDGM